MKFTLLTLITFLLICPSLPANNNQYKQEDNGGIEMLEFNYHGIKREYALHVPVGVSSNAPLVFFLHGSGGHADAYEGFMGLDAVADQHGFVVVYPQGLLDDFGKESHWNAGLTISKVDDLGFLASLANYLQQEYNLSPEKTFTSGVSNGGFMSYYLVSERPDVFKAAASIYGTMSGKNWENRNKACPVPIFQLSAALDKMVPIDGSISEEGGWKGAPAMDTVIDFWADLNKCSIKDTLKINEHTTAYCHRAGVGGNEVWYYLIDNFGHHDLPLGQDGSVHVSRLIWEFFSRY